jgi:NhaP-type Na+/H+ or K+/H+ antiporter
VDSTLNGLVLGESLLNDAVAIVLTGSIAQYALIANQGEAFEVNRNRSFS